MMPNSVGHAMMSLTAVPQTERYRLIGSQFEYEKTRIFCGEMKGYFCGCEFHNPNLILHIILRCLLVLVFWKFLNRLKGVIKLREELCVAIHFGTAEIIYII